MTEDAAELETRPAEAKRNEKPDLARLRENDDEPRPKDGPSNDREEQEIDELPAPRPRWPLVLVGLFVAIFAAMILFIIFRPHANIRTDDAYVTVHYAAIAPRISGQVATVPVDDNDVVKTGQVLATLDPRDNELHWRPPRPRSHATDRNSMRSPPQRHANRRS
jgi:membrane fusion protein (multidrug efflux system)